MCKKWGIWGYIADMKPALLLSTEGIGFDPKSYSVSMLQWLAHKDTRVPQNRSWDGYVTCPNVKL